MTHKKREKIKLVKSAFIKEEEVRQQLANFVRETKFFSMGTECKKYEKAFAEKQKRKYALFVNSGSNANLALIQTLLNMGTLQRGDKVGVSAVTWSTNIMPLLQLGLAPVVIDCEKETLNISSRTLAPHAEELRGLFLTNVLGFCGDIENIKNICKQNDIIFFEDNCESLGSKAYGKLLGNFGIASTFSFFLGHHLSTLEGGMVCTDDKDIYNMLLMVRAHGWDRNLDVEDQISLRNRYGVDPFYALYTFYDLGYNMRPTELNGFLGNIQIQHWENVVETREKNFKIFHEKIQSSNDFISLEVDYMNTISNFAIPVICKDKETRNKYMSEFRSAGVEIRPIISGNIAQQPFFKKYVSAEPHCPNAHAVHENGFYFANNTELTNEELEKLGSLL